MASYLYWKIKEMKIIRKTLHLYIMNKLISNS